jgi:Nucleoporin autopeptidase
MAYQTGWNTTVAQPFGVTPGFTGAVSGFNTNSVQPGGFPSGFSSGSMFNSTFNQPKSFGAQPAGFSQASTSYMPTANTWGGPSSFGNPSQPTNFTTPNTGFSGAAQGFMNNTFANPNVAPNPGFNALGGPAFTSALTPSTNPNPPTTGFNPSAFGGGSFGNPTSFNNNPGGFSNPNTFNTNPTGFASNNNAFTSGNGFNPPSNTFGNNNPVTTTFGNNGLFNSNNLTGGNSFGTGNFGQSGSVRYKATPLKEDNSTITVLNICAMGEVAGKSLEEQRLFDYKQRTTSTFNNPAPQGLNAGISQPNLFSNPLSSNQPNSLFNKQPDPKPAVSLFNTNPTSLFSNTSLFQNNTSTPSLFSVPNNNPNPGSMNTAAPSLFNTSNNFFSNQTTMPNNNPASLFSNPNPQTSSLFSFSAPQSSLFQNKPQPTMFNNNNNPNPNPNPQPDYLRSAFKDPHGLSWLFPETVPENISKSYTQRISTQISAEPASIVERIVKPKRINNYPQVLTEKWKNSQEKKYLKTQSSFDLISQKKSEPFFVVKRPSFMNLKLEEYKDEDNNKYFKIPGTSSKKIEKTSEIVVVAYDPNPIRMVIPVSLSTSIREIKYQVARHLPDTDDTSVQLVYKSRILQDEDSIKSVGISNNDELIVLNIPAQSSTNRDLPSDDMLPTIAPGYKTKPTLVEMARMSIEDLKKIKNFTIENEFGKLVFEGETNVIGLSISEIIRINHKELVGYPDDSEVNKPDIGQGLNKPAILTLYQYDINGTKEKFEQKFKVTCSKFNMEFQSYDPTAKELQVRIKHF